MVEPIFVLITVILSAVAGARLPGGPGLVFVLGMASGVSWAFGFFWFPTSLELVACVLAWFVVYRYRRDQEQQMAAQKRAERERAKQKKRESKTNYW